MDSYIPNQRVPKLIYLIQYKVHLRTCSPLRRQILGPSQKFHPNLQPHLSQHTKPTPTQHNGITDTPRPLRQEARSILQHRRRARPVRPLPNPHSRCGSLPNPPLPIYTASSHIAITPLTLPQHRPQLAPARSPRHLRPQAATTAARRHTRAAMERHTTRHIARAILGGRGCAAERYGVAVTQHGGDSGAAV